MKNTLQARAPQIVDQKDWRYFTLTSRTIRAFKRKDASGTERYLINGTASSSVKDLYGDILTEKCQSSMLAQAKGLTMWLNHSYIVPEDVAGVCTEPKLTNTTAKDGTACVDLDITLDVDPENPRAFKSWQHVERGTGLGFSIGGFFTVYDLVFDGKDDYVGHFVVDDLKLLEISLVGIPANPQAYTKMFERAHATVNDRAKHVARHHGSQSLAWRRGIMRVMHGLTEHPKRDAVKVRGIDTTVPASAYYDRPSSRSTVPASAYYRRR